MNAALQLPVTPCVQTLRERPYRESLPLADGRRVLLRPAHHADAPALQDLFTGLSPRSRRRRFHGAVNRVPDAMLQVLSTQVPRRHVALVALARTDDGLERLVAEARYVIGHERAGHAEFALAIADEFQGLGLGRAMLQRLAAHAAANGVDLLFGHVLEDNAPMLALMRRLGATLAPSDGGVRASLVL